MNKLNKFLILFILFFIVLSWGGWEFIQSEKFSSILTGHVAKKVEEYTNSRIKFARIEFQLFPPATLLKNIEFKYEDKDTSLVVDLSASDLGLYFNILDVFSNTLSIQKVKINDGVCFLNIPGLNFTKNFFEDLIYKSNGEDESFNLSNTFDKYQEIYRYQKNFKINNLELNDLKLNINESSVAVEHLKIAPDLKSLNANIYLSALKLYKPEKNSLDLNLDEFLISTKIERKFIDIQNVLIKKKHSTITGTILFKQEKGKNTINADVGISGPIPEFLNQFQGNRKIGQIDGLINLKALVKDDIENPNASVEVRIDKLESIFLNAQTAEVKLYKNGDKIGVEEGSILNDGGALTYSGHKDIFNLKNKKFINDSVRVKLERMHTDTILYYLKETFHPLKARLDGFLSASWSEDGLKFYSEEAVKVSDFKLLSSNPNVPIISNPGLEIDNFLVSIDWNGPVSINTNVKFLNNQYSIEGVVNDSNIDINLYAEKFDFENFGAVSGVPFKGLGKMNLKILGNTDGINFDFNTELKSFSLIGVEFGDVVGEFNLDLDDLRLNLKYLRGEYKQTQYSADGYFLFGDEEEFDLDVDFKKTNFENLRHIFPSVVSGMTFLPLDLEFDLKTKLKVYGGYSVKDLVIEGDLDFKNLFFWGEDVDWLKTKFLMSNEVVNLNSIEYLKSTARGNGLVIFDMNKKALESEINIKKARLNDFNFYKKVGLGYDAEVEGEISSRGLVSNLETRGLVKSYKATLGGKQAQGSELFYKGNGTMANFNGQILGGLLEFKSKLDFSGSLEKKSLLDLKIETDKVSNLLGLISEHNLIEDKIEGNILLGFSSQFSLENLASLDLLFNIDRFSLVTNKIAFGLEKKAKVEIVDGQIKDWDLKFLGKNINIFSKGEGRFSDKAKIVSSFSCDPSILEILVERMQFLSGELNGTVNISSEYKKFFTTTHVFGDNISYKHNNLPSVFTGVSFQLDGLDRKFFIQKFNGIYGGGQFSASGPMEFKLPYPGLDLVVSLDGGNIPILKKSNMVINAKGKIQGDDIPYVFSGNVNLLHANIIDEFTEFSKSKKQISVSSRFIPVIAKDEDEKLMKYNFDLNISRPIVVKNNIADFRLNGFFNFKGHDSVLVPKGELSTISGVSKFVFKSNEFTLEDGKILFSGDEKNNDPYFKFLGTTRVNEYFIKMDFEGKLSNFNINFTSDPLLSQEDIISLLTVGLTLDKSKGLNANELQSVTSIGLGSLLLDQFGINQGLKSSLGLKLSVLPEYQKSQVSPITSATSSGDLATSRLRSATKLRLEKKINKKMDMSVSSTVGGSVEQKREMNVDYNINKSYSVKGVYEVRSSSGTETKENSNSMGMDFIFRRTFK